MGTPKQARFISTPDPDVFEASLNKHMDAGYTIVEYKPVSLKDAQTLDEDIYGTVRRRSQIQYTAILELAVIHKPANET